MSFDELEWSEMDVEGVVEAEFCVSLLLPP
jgi:hypothetical protein